MSYFIAEVFIAAFTFGLMMFLMYKSIDFAEEICRKIHRFELNEFYTFTETKCNKNNCKRYKKFVLPLSWNFELPKLSSNPCYAEKMIYTVYKDARKIAAFLRAIWFLTWFFLNLSITIYFCLI